MVKEIPLQNGMVALVDDEDFERVNKYTWSFTVFNKTRIQVRTTVENETICLSRFIISAKDEEFIYFKDRNPLNCQKHNLNIVDKVVSSFVRKANAISTSRYRGVSWDKRANKWRAQIKVNGVAKSLGRYNDEDEAALAYNNASRSYFGEKSFQNLIGEDNRAISFDGDRRPQRRTNSISGYKGVRNRKGIYSSQITIDKKMVHIGYSKTPEEAAKAYDQKAYELHGDKAILNFPQFADEYKSN